MLQDKTAKTWLFSEVIAVVSSRKGKVRNYLGNFGHRSVLRIEHSNSQDSLLKDERSKVKFQLRLVKVSLHTPSSLSFTSSKISILQIKDECFPVIHHF